MEKVIYKYAVSIGSQEFYFPAGFKILHFDQQGNGLYIWVLVKPHEIATTKCEINVIGTGWERESVSDNHIGSVVTTEGYVWHAFQL